LTFPDGRFQASCRNFPTPANILFSRGSVLGRLFTQKFYTLPEYSKITPVPAAAGAVMIVRKPLFMSIGGFDERFFMYPEDMDFCLRVNQLGHSVLFVPSATAIHGWGQGSKTGLLRRTWYHHYSIWQYFLKHGPQGFALTVLPVLLLFNFLLTILILPFRGKNSDDDLTNPPS
jgi:GT2 family glycosyltransferase